jgi:hypothetical protein
MNPCPQHPDESARLLNHHWNHAGTMLPAELLAQPLKSVALLAACISKHHFAEYSQDAF